MCTWAIYCFDLGPIEASLVNDKLWEHIILRDFTINIRITVPGIFRLCVLVYSHSTCTYGVTARQRNASFLLSMVRVTVLVDACFFFAEPKDRSDNNCCYCLLLP